jgi:hypothetical protein
MDIPQFTPGMKRWLFPLFEAYIERMRQWLKELI